MNRAADTALEDDILSDEGLKADPPVEPEPPPEPVIAEADEEGEERVAFADLPKVDLSAHSASVDAKIATQEAKKKGRLPDETPGGMKVTAGPGISAKKDPAQGITAPRAHDPGHQRPAANPDEKSLIGAAFQKFENKIMEYRNSRADYEAAQADADRYKKIMKNDEAWLHSLMSEYKIPSYKSSIGTLIVSKTFTVKIPKSLEEKRETFNWILKQEGQDAYDGMIGINSKTFNKYYREKQEAAFDDGDLDFQIPGIEEPKFIEKFSVRSK